MTRFSRPTTKQDVRAFLGLTGYYRRFIPEYAKRTGHLTDALGGKRPKKVEWTLKMQGEFEDLKAALSGDTVLHAPDFNCDFTLQTDASCRAIGPVLSQHFEEEGGERPIAYFSRKLNGAQQRYTATEKECLAIVQAIKHFAVYLIGRRFSLQTDHKALQKLKTMDNDNQRLMRWQCHSSPTNSMSSTDQERSSGMWMDYPGRISWKHLKGRRGEMSGLPLLTRTLSPQQHPSQKETPTNVTTRTPCQGKGTVCGLFSFKLIQA